MIERLRCWCDDVQASRALDLRPREFRIYLRDRERIVDVDCVFTEPICKTARPNIMPLTPVDFCWRSRSKFAFVRCAFGGEDGIGTYVNDGAYSTSLDSDFIVILG